MAETSLFWDGTTLGDASIATYDDEEIAGVFKAVFGNFVIPATSSGTLLTAGELNVYDDLSATGEVHVGPGSAFVNGILYDNDDIVDVSIPNNAAGNPVIHRVVLDMDTAAQTARITLSTGTPAATPAPPAVAANEMTLAWVWIPAGFTAAADNVGDQFVHDERVFRDIGVTATDLSRKNLLQNAEFLAWSGAASNAAPDKWLVAGTPTFLGALATFPGRSRDVRMQCATNNEGIETTVSCNTANVGTYTLTGYFDVAQGEWAISVARIDLATGTATSDETKVFYPSSGINYFTIRGYAGIDEALRVRVFSGSAAAVDDIRIGNFVLSMGYNTTLAYNHEIIWFDYALTDAAWTATAKSTGATTISLAPVGVGDFLGITYPHIRGAIVRARIRDSGSVGAASGTCQLEFYHALDTPPTSSPVGILSAAGEANDSWIEQVVYVPIDHADATCPFKVYVKATGAGLMDVTLEIIGIIT